MSCEWPTSSCTLAVSASLRCSVGARRIHSRSGRTPISSESPCISMNLMSLARYSSGIQSPVSTCPPPCTYSTNSWVRASTWPPTERSLGSVYLRPPERANPPGRAALRREGLPRHVDRRPRGGPRRPDPHDLHL